MNCPGCLKAGLVSYCAPCRKRMFNGRKVSHVLTFSRPFYNQAKLSVAAARLSISGIQTKMPITLRGRHLEITDSIGQYILKPIPHGEFQHLNAVPINEHLTMQIARQVFGISVAANTLVSFNEGELGYLVRRFDLQEDGSRLLQEDFAQIANRSDETHGANYKYDFSYEGIGDLIRKFVAAYPVALERFFQLVVYNFLVNNGDAHLKNFSLIRNDLYGDYTLSPAYDLLNTRLHVPNEERMALALFKNDFETDSFKVNSFYAYDDFRELARRMDLREHRFRDIMKAFTGKEQAVISLINRSALPQECKHLYKVNLQDSIQALSYSFSGHI